MRGARKTIVRGKARETELGRNDMEAHSHPLLKNSAEGPTTNSVIYALRLNRAFLWHWLHASANTTVVGSMKSSRIPGEAMLVAAADGWGWTGGRCRRSRYPHPLTPGGERGWR